MKHLFLFICCITTLGAFAQFPWLSDKIMVRVSNAQEQPIAANVVIEGLPDIKFKGGYVENNYTVYYLDKADYPTQKDTLYFLKIAAEGYPTARRALGLATLQIALFKPGETYVYEGGTKTPAYYDNRYLACIYPIKAKVDSFCKAYNLSIAYSYDYCGGSWKGHKTGAPNTFILQKKDSSAFGDEDEIAKAFRDSFPQQAGSFYSRGQGYPYGVLIYSANTVELSFANAATFTKVEEYVKTIAGATYQNRVYGNYAPWQLMQVTLPNSWNIAKLNAFIDTAVDIGAIGAHLSGVTALECPN